MERTRSPSNHSRFSSRPGLDTAGKDRASEAVQSSVVALIRLRERASGKDETQQRR
jgi:hypothetical protein